MATYSNGRSERNTDEESDLIAACSLCPQPWRSDILKSMDAAMTFTLRMWPGRFGAISSREAAALMKTLGKQDARVEIERVTTGQRWTGNSFLLLTTWLSHLRDRDVVRVSADGPDADEAVTAAVHALKERGAYGGSVDSLGPDPTPDAMLAFHERAVWLAEWTGRQIADVRSMPPDELTTKALEQFEAELKELLAYAVEADILSTFESEAILKSLL
jgi:phosphotransferase system HPr-like phosphotransfer protein